MSANLLFGTFAIIKKSSSSSWEYAADGRYWYNTICEEYNDANILDAFQYASMKHHINGCTVVDAYNKKNNTSLPYTTNLSDEQLKTITELECSGKSKSNEEKIISVNGVEKLERLKILQMVSKLLFLQVMVNGVELL